MGGPSESGTQAAQATQQAEFTAQLSRRCSYDNRIITLRTVTGSGTMWFMFTEGAVIKGFVIITVAASDVGIKNAASLRKVLATEVKSCRPLRGITIYSTKSDLDTFEGRVAP